MRVFLEVGDWSRDGHNMSEVFEVTYKTNYGPQLQDAYRKGAELIGWNFVDDAAGQGYEEGWLTKEEYDKLGHYFNIQKYASLEEKYDSDELIGFFHEGAYSYCGIWMEIAKLGNPQLEWVITEPHSESIKIGGYGMYQS